MKKYLPIFNVILGLALCGVAYAYSVMVRESYEKGLMDTYHVFIIMSTITVGLLALHLIVMDVVKSLFK